jgi:hypothetical protein
VPLMPIPLGCFFLYKALKSFNRSPPPIATDARTVLSRPLHPEPVYKVCNCCRPHRLTRSPLQYYCRESLLHRVRSCGTPRPEEVRSALTARNERHRAPLVQPTCISCLQVGRAIIDLITHCCGLPRLTFCKLVRWRCRTQARCRQVPR